MSWLQQHLQRIIVIFLGINILGLWVVEYFQFQSLSGQEIRSTGGVESGQPRAGGSSQALQITQLQDEVASLSAQVTTSTQKPVIIKSGGSTTQSASTLKEQTIYIGSGSSSKTDWTDLDATVFELNTASYPSLQTASFEATLSVVGGEASARLRNKTTGQIITASEVAHNTSVSTQKVSGSFELTTGSNVYVVQLRSNSNETANLHSSRLRLRYR